MANEGLSPESLASSPWLWVVTSRGVEPQGGRAPGEGPLRASSGCGLVVTGLLLSPDIVSNKIVHFDLLHEDVSLQYFIPAFS